MKAIIFSKTLAFLTLATLPMLASAQLSANVSLVTNYKTRGQDQDVREGKLRPALQGGFDYAHSNGFYAGNWNSTVYFQTSATGSTANLESDLYAGYKFEAGGLAWDVGMLRYHYTGASAFNTTEVYLGMGWGPLSAKYYHTVSDDYFNAAGSSLGSGLKGKGTGYLNVAFAQEVAPKWTLKASLGYTSYSSDISLPNYVDYSIGAARDLGEGFSVSGAMVGASKKNSFLGKADGGSVNANTIVVMFTRAM
ncbi:MAG: TorF family putative porin [Hydrogenophaga sp.]|uniref:TorF family putative porin n=1 Tax=Hydrogenophaga sp. TaxID=1904254 RepID=UPI002734177E|nr:TorF family putative porin [Hydrogenophaga sp.]MDP3349898.1 TorF family putative porin [Hydrogenophaga sp.]